jgi:transcriptional regulator with XRE-family HTH domain
MNIGDNIKSQRLKRRLTLTELSLKSGVQLATLSRIENNKMSGTVKSHKSIAQAFR